MRELWRMYIYLPLTLFVTGFCLYGLIHQKGGQKPLQAEKLDIKSIRKNPTAFRTTHLPYIFRGGK
ncbi:MAG: hypothetical protein N2Z22_02230 [Turneriella sp.]|nr:hypothetical protein [Leptospiraceae bacterium]MCX7632133.1 hypothetical protein [Turneriella sp.]